MLDIAGHRAEPADVLIDGETIRQLGPPGMAVPAEAQVVDAAHRLLMPGLVNAHTHGHGSLAKGLGDRWSLELLLNAGPWVGGSRTLEDKYLAAKINAVEMVRKGCTAAYDLYVEYPLPTVEGLEAVARAYQEVGMRVVVAPMMADRLFYEAIPGLMESLPKSLRARVEQVRAAPYEESVAACRQVLEHWPFDRGKAALALAPTIPLHCSDAFIVACRDLAAEYGVGLHMHLAESKAQAVSGIKRYGKTLTAHLDGLGFLGPNFTGAHCVWLTDEDIQRLGDNGASVAHNPGSNLRLGSGIAPARAMLEGKVTLAIGTDASHCSDNQNRFEAVRLASFVSRVGSPETQSWLSTAEVLSAATEGGARTLGMGDAIGRLAPEYQADIVLLDLNNVNYLPCNDPTNQIVHSEDSSAVDGVMIAGRMVLQDGRFTTLDLEQLRRDAESATERLRGATADSKELALMLEEHVGRYCVGLGREHYPINRWVSG